MNLKTLSQSNILKAVMAFIVIVSLHSQLYADDEKNPCGALLCILGGQTSGECRKYYEYYTIGLPKECEKQCRGTHYATCLTTCIPSKQIAHLKNCKLESAPNSVPVNNNAYNSGANQFIANLDSKINEASQIDGDCTKAELNRVEKKLLRTDSQQNCDDEGRCNNVYTKIYAYRINASPTKTCEILANQTYSTIKIKYTCDKSFYEEKDWNNGYVRKNIAKAVYDNLASKDKEFELSYKNIGYSNYLKLDKSERRVIKSKPDDEGRTYDIYQQIITTYYQRLYIQKDCWEVEERVYG